MFSISRHLEKEIKERKGEEGERKGDVCGEYIGVVPSENDLPSDYPYGRFPYSVEDAIFFWLQGVSVHLDTILRINYQYWSSRIKHVWGLLLDEWSDFICVA